MEKEYVFFWKTASPFSNWHPSKFKLEDIMFENTEQHMMWSKAMIMRDFETAKKILATSDPRTIKALGQEVKNFNSPLWDSVKFHVVFSGCMAKFSQNENLKKALLETGDKEICEASPFDRIWGLGVNEQTAKMTAPETWPGENLLGKVLMQVRDELKK